MVNIYQKILFFGISVLMIFMPLARGTVKVWSMAPFLLVSYSLIFLWLWNINNKQKKTALLAPEDSAAVRATPVLMNISLFLFGLLATISFIFSIYKHDSLFALLRLFAYIGIFYLLINNFEGRMFRKLLGLAVLMGTALSLYGILQYLDFFKHSWWIPGEFLAATYVNHNHFAGYLELVIPVTLGISFSRSIEFKFKKIVLWLALYVQALAFILTQSRGGWFSLLIAFLAMGLVLVRNKRIKARHFAAFIILITVFFGFVYLNDREVAQRMQTIRSITYRGRKIESSLESRNKIWEGALGMIKDRPIIGAGIGDFDAGFYRFRPEGFQMRAVYAHNDYLHMAAEMGILSPLLMILLFSIIVVSGIRQGSHPLVLGCAMGVFSLALHGLVDFNFHIPANMLLFTVCAAYVMRPRRGR